jgi:hypothetical protein
MNEIAKQKNKGNKKVKTKTIQLNDFSSPVILIRKIIINIIHSSNIIIGIPNLTIQKSVSIG